MPRRRHLVTLFTSPVLFILHPMRDDRLQLCAQVRAVERFFFDDDEVLVFWVGAVPLEGI